MIWGTVGLAVTVPIALASQSPYLAWRQPIYISAGYAGIAGLALLLLQPLLAKGALPGLHPMTSRRLHRATGAVLTAAVLLHVIGLWITSPPDVIDALTFRSPTPFSAFGVVAMWACFLAAALALFRRRIRPKGWRFTHKVLTTIIVTGTIIHALLIEGTMEPISKALLCLIVVAAATWAMHPTRTQKSQHHHNP